MFENTVSADLYFSSIKTKLLITSFSSVSIFDFDKYFLVLQQKREIEYQVLHCHHDVTVAFIRFSIVWVKSMFCSEGTTNFVYFAKNKKIKSKNKNKKNYQDFDEYVWSWSTSQILCTNGYCQ